MKLINDLGSDVALAVLIEKRHTATIDSKEIFSLITRIREILEPISARDHSHLSEQSEAVMTMGKTH